MEIIKRKISLDDYISKDPKNWGTLTVNNFYLNLFITQDSDDMGIMTDIPFIEKNDTEPNYDILISKLRENNHSFTFMNGGVFSSQLGNNPCTRYPDKQHWDYFVPGDNVSALTEDRLDVVRSYDRDEPFKIGFDVNIDDYINYNGDLVDGVTRVVSNDNFSPIIYTEDVDVNDPNLGTPDQENGILLSTNENNLRPVFTSEFGLQYIPTTQIWYNAEGFNETNTLLSASTKEEYLFGITTTPEVQDDVFIDRGRTTILQSHMQMGEITNMAELINYGNGFYNIIK